MGYFNYSQKSTLRHWQTQLEEIMAKEESEQTTFIWWDGKQKKLSDFCKELGIEQCLENDPDDEDCSYEAVYKKNRVE